MSNGTNILNVVIHLTLFVLWRAPSRFTRIDSLENTEATKVLEGNLKLLKTGGSTDEGSIDTTVVLLANLSKARQLALAAHARVSRGFDGLFLRASLYSIPHGYKLYTTTKVG